MHRRRFLAGLTGFIAAAPALVRAESLMAVSPVPRPRFVLVGETIGMPDGTFHTRRWIVAEPTEVALRNFNRTIRAMSPADWNFGETITLPGPLKFGDTFETLVRHRG